MKKLGLGILGIIIVAAIYYFTAGSAQLATQMKAQVDAELATLQTQGFSVEGREVSEKKEHFVIALHEPQKVATYLTTQGAQVSAEDIEALKGFKIGIDVAYLADAYSAASFDIYPVALPTALTSANMNDKDRQILQQIEKMIEKKTFLVHVDVNKLGTGFKGYMKDIDEAVEGKKAVTFTMKALKFSGDLEKGKLKSIKQTVKTFAMKEKDNETNIQLNNLESSYTSTGNTRYDYTTSYTIHEILFRARNTLKLSLDNISVDSVSATQNNLASLAFKTKIETIHIQNHQKNNTVKDIAFTMNANHFDVQAMKKLESINPNNKKELLDALQKLISHGIHFDIPNFSVRYIEIDNQNLDGFTLTSTVDIDKSFNISTFKHHPVAALDAINAKLKTILSNRLFEFIATQPQAVLAMMLFQPEDINGTKVYTIELKNGKLLINNQALM